MTGVSLAKRGHTLQISRNFAEIIVLRSAKEASGKAATSSRRKHEELRLQLTASGLGTGVRLASSRTRGLASSATEKSACSRKPLPGSPRPEAPRNFPAAGTLLLASVEPAGPVPSGAHSVASERLVRRALGREAANAKVTSKKSKFRGSKRRQTDDSFHPSLHSERIQTDALGLAACDEARPAKVQKSFALPEPILCNGVPY